MMAEPRDVIKDAFEKLKRSISEEDAHNFASTELQDVFSAVKDIDSRQRKRSSAQNLRRADSLLRGLEKYTKVIEVLCNGTPYMPYVWAPIKLMLEIASHHRDVFEALLSAYADIGAALPRFDRYQTAFNDNLEFRHALAVVYSGILEFHQRAYKFFRRRAWHVIFLSLWKDFGNRFESIINSLKKQREFLDIEAASFDIVEAKDSRMEIREEIRKNHRREQERVEENERAIRASQMQHSITWLSTDEKTLETAFERISRRRYDKTCEWISKEPRWSNWIKDDSRDLFLWLDGKPGSGKSVMCSYIVQTLTSIPDLTACYYFCNSQDTGNICHQILTIFALQIIKQHPELCTLIANEYLYSGTTCSMAQLKNLVPQLLQIVGYTRIIIDGIDECPTIIQKDILRKLQAICLGSSLHCKILFSSRREVHIREKLASQPQIHLDGRREVRSDIRSFVKYKVTKLHTSDQDLREKIERILVEKADGMFLWVRLVVDELKDCYSDATLLETATALPKGLKAAYGRILDRIIDPDNTRMAKSMSIRMLSWMACSYRVLKTYELVDGLAFNASNTTLTAKTKIKKDILDFCRPLIEEGPGNTVDFVHFSAKQYILEENYQGEHPFIERRKAHWDIAFSCTALLNSCASLLPTVSNDFQRAAIIVQGFHGLQVYADKFWYMHLLDYCKISDEQQRQFCPQLLQQLRLLLRFRKTINPTTQISKPVTREQPSTYPAGLQALSHVLDVHLLLSDIISFIDRMKSNHCLDKSLENISLDWCDLDPTVFSSLRYCYRETTESLLNEGAANMFPEIERTAIEEFQSIYGASAFLCRYPHCVFNNDGFESSVQRDKHESQHQRQFRCEHSWCFASTSGFISQSYLNKHNEKYHPTIELGPSLAECLNLTPFTKKRINMQEGSHSSPSTKLLSQKESFRETILNDSQDENEASSSSLTGDWKRRSVEGKEEEDQDGDDTNGMDKIEGNPENPSENTEHNQDDDNGDKSVDLTRTLRRVPLQFKRPEHPKWSRKLMAWKRCMCRKNVDGEKILCCNDDCSYKWFHRSCVGLKNKVVAIWVCPTCAEAGELISRGEFDFPRLSLASKFAQRSCPQASETKASSLYWANNFFVGQMDGRWHKTNVSEISDFISVDTRN